RARDLDDVPGPEDSGVVHDDLIRAGIHTAVRLGPPCTRLRVVPVELRRPGGALPCPHEDDQERVRIRDEACDLLGNVNVPAVTVNPESGNGGVGRRGGKSVIELTSHCSVAPPPMLLASARRNKNPTGLLALVGSLLLLNPRLSRRFLVFALGRRRFAA